MNRLGRQESGINVYHGPADKLLLSMGSDINVIVDPDFDSGYDAVNAINSIYFCDGKRAHDVIDVMGAPHWIFTWDCVSSWYTGKNNPLKRSKLALWYGKNYSLDGASINTGNIRHNIKSKNSRGIYQSTGGDSVIISDLYRLPITNHSLNRLHKYEKPLPWVCSLIGGCFDKKYPVVDLYAGSFVGMDACYALGYEYHGCDIKLEYCEMAANRKLRKPIYRGSYRGVSNLQTTMSFMDKQ